MTDSSVTRAVVEAFLEASTGPDRMTIPEQIADDVVISEPPGLPYGGIYEGRHGLAELRVRMAACWSELRGSGAARRVMVDGDTAIVIGAIRGTLVATGREVSVRVIEEYLVRDGRIVEIRPFYFDPSLGEA